MRMKTISPVETELRRLCSVVTDSICSCSFLKRSKLVTEFVLSLNRIFGQFLNVDNHIPHRLGEQILYIGGRERITLFYVEVNLEALL